jgi:hypothetical protein
MNNHSFIFSFKIQKDKRHYQLLIIAFVLFLVFLLLTNFIIFRLTLPYNNSSRIGKIVRSLWANKANKKNEATALFIGSSRFHSCIVASIFNEYAQKKGIDISFHNLAQSNMDYWEYSRVFTYVLPSSLNTKLVVIEVSPQTFNAKRRNPITKEIIKYPREFEHWASLEEILSTESLGIKIELLYKKLVPRQSLKDRLWTLKNIINTDAINPDLPIPEFHYDKDKEMKLRKDPTFFPENISRHHMMNYYFSDKKKDSFLKFLCNLRNQGCEVIIVQPPVKEQYFDYIRSDADMLKEYQQHIAFLKQLSLDYVLINWQTPDMANLNESVFVDYGHFTLEGAKQFSGLLLSSIKEQIDNIDSSQTLEVTAFYRSCE